MNKYLTMLTAALVSILSFSSCTDQEDVDISFDTVTGITAAHIFSDYEPYQTGDFDLSIDGWKLNLQVLIYNNDGELVDQAEKVCSSISETLDYTTNLKSGEYTVICIADFRDGLGGSGYKFWDITNTANLQNLSITENEDTYPVVFETLGLDIQTINVIDKQIEIKADIKPYTALVHIYMNNDDHIGYGLGGYSRFVPVCAGYFIKANKSKKNVKVENGAFAAQYPEQISEYNLEISQVTNDWLNNENPLKHSYRALLPDNDCSFKWHIQENELDDDDPFKKYAGSIITDGVGNQSIDINSGKQYVINMILDCLSMEIFEYPEDFKAKDYTQSQVDDFLKNSIDKMLTYNFESILERDENFANVFLGASPESYKWSNTLYLAHYPRPGIERFEIERTVGYLNERKDCAVIVQFLMPHFSDNVLQYFRQKMTYKYRIDQEYTSPDNYCFLNPDISVDSRYRIVLQKVEKDSETYYFLYYILRDAYLPKDDNETEDLESLIFPYEWETFLGQSPDSVTSELGNNYQFENDTWVYSNYNKIISVFVSNFYSSEIDTVGIKVSPTDEVNTVIKNHLKSRFIETSPGYYADSEDILSQTLMISYQESSGMILYSAF